MSKRPPPIATPAAKRAKKAAVKAVVNVIDVAADDDAEATEPSHIEDEAIGYDTGLADSMGNDATLPEETLAVVESDAQPDVESYPSLVAQANAAKLQALAPGAKTPADIMTAYWNSLNTNIDTELPQVDQAGAISLLNHIIGRLPTLTARELTHTLRMLVAHARDKKYVLDGVSAAAITAGAAALTPVALFSIWLLLTWYKYDGLAGRLQRAVTTGFRGMTPIKKTIMSTTDAIPSANFWAVLWVTDETDPEWVKLCRANRVLITSLSKTSCPPTPLFDVKRLPTRERTELRNHVYQLSQDAVRGNASQRLVAWAWIDAFWDAGISEDHFGEIARLAIAMRDKARIKSLVQRGVFAKFERRTLLNTIWAKMLDAKDEEGEGLYMMIAATLDAPPAEAAGAAAAGAERPVPLASYHGLAGPLLRMALKKNDAAMYAQVIRAAPQLGDVTGAADIVKSLVKDLAVDLFESFVSLETIDVSHVWRTFATSVTGKHERELEMFRVFLKRQGEWMYEYRSHVRSTLEKRELMTFLIEFSDFEQERGDPVESKAAIKAMFETMKRMAAEKAKTATVNRCLNCDEPAATALMCGHRIGCMACLEKLVDSSHGRCPTCNTDVKRNAGGAPWYIKVYDT
jgi:hypothetical protein